LIGEFDVLAGRILSEAIEIRLDLTPDAGSCHVDPSQFGAMLLNLVVNARDAMPQGGTLTIKTMNVDFDVQQAGTLPDCVPGSYIAVIVEDTGTGMSPDVLTRATEPFFTTKDPGRGTGLGLSQVYGFVRQSGGFLGIESTLERGTTITVYLPRREGTERITHIANTACATGYETILVVEDDEDVSSVVIESLSTLGYEPLVARSAHEALELMQSRAGPLPHLVLTDVVMPGGMSGIDLCNEIRQQWPTVKVLLTSGYAAGGQLAQEGEALTDVPMLSKPYRLAEFGLAIRTALDT
jgi:CheY-like chemotaxis protein